MAVRERLCEVYNIAGERFGSGYLVGDRAVLTSGHVVAAAGSLVKVRCGAEGQPFEATVVWRRYSPGREDELDAALVEITDPRWTSPPEGAPVRWGRLVGNAPVRFEAAGFPDFQVDLASDGKPRMRDTEQAFGEIHPLTALKRGLLTMDVTTSTPRATPHRTFWGGNSGAPVLCGGLLTGVVKQVPTGYGDKRLQAVQVAECLRDPEFRHVIAALCGRVPDLEPVELDSLAHKPDRPHSPASLLLADVQAVGFEGREDLLTELQEWCRAPGGYSVRALTGPGGQGKTRLAQELGRLMRAEGWAVLDLAKPPAEGQDPDAYTCLTTLDTPLLLIIDYAEARHEQMAAVAKHLAGTQVPARLLLVARALGEWQSRYVIAAPGLDGLAVGQLLEIPVPVLADTAARRQEVFRRALAGLGAGLTSLPEYRHIDWNAIGTDLPTPDLSRAETVLAVHIAALAALLRHGLPQQAPTQDGPPEQVLLAHETRYWQDTARAADLEIPKKILPKLVAVASLYAATDDQEARSVLAQLPETSVLAADDRARTADWLHTLYPDSSSYWGMLQPDLLAEHLVGQILAWDEKAFDVVLAAADPASAVHALLVLSRAALGRQLVTRVTTRLVREYPAPLAPAAAFVATVTENPAPLLAGVDAILAADNHDPAVLEAVDDAIPSATTILRGRAERIEALLVAHHRARDRAERGRRPLHRLLTPRRLTSASADLAQMLRYHAISLAQLGQYRQSVDEFAEAVRLLRRLAERDVQTHGPRLADTLIMMCEPLAALGRHPEVLAVAQEALEIQQRYAPADGEPDVSALRIAALNLRVKALQETGQLGEALAAAETAAEVCRVLPDEEQREILLALTTMNLGMIRRENGLLDVALAATSEAVRLLTSLTERWPDIYTPWLAHAQINNAATLFSLGQVEKALAAGDEAVRLLRPLTDLYPEPFNEQLALALSNQVAGLRQADRAAEAVEPAAEALKLQRVLAEAYGGVHVSRLALALVNHAAVLSALDQDEEARAAVDEALRLLHALPGGAVDDAVAPILVQVLIMMSGSLLDAGEPAGPTAEEAVKLCRDLATRYPAAHEPTLVMALGALVQALLDEGETERAETAAADGLRVARRLAASRTARDLDLLASALDATAHVLIKCDRHTEARTALDESAGIAMNLFATDHSYDANEHVWELSHLGFALARLGRFDEALAVGLATRELYRTLAEARPDAYTARLASACATVSYRLSKLDRTEEALEAQQEAVRLCRVLADGGAPQQAQLADALEVLATRQIAVGSTDEAVEVREEAAELYRQLNENDPGKYAAQRADTLIDLAVQYVLDGWAQRALERANEAADLLRPLAAADHAAHDADLVRALIVASSALAQLRRHDEAAQATAEAVALQDAAPPTADDEDASSIPAALSAEAQKLLIAVVGGRAPDGATQAARLVEKLRPYQAADADGWQALLGQALVTFAIAHLGDNQLPEALQAAREAEELGRDLAASDPPTFTPLYASTLFTLAQALWRSDEDDDALTAVDAAVQRFIPLAAVGPEVYVPALSEVREYRGHMLAYQDRLDEASTEFAEAADLLRPLVAGDSRLGGQLVPILAHLGRNLARAEHPAEARKTLNEALTVSEQLDTAVRDQLTDTLDDIRSQLDELGDAP